MEPDTSEEARVWLWLSYKGKGHMLEATYATRDGRREEIAIQPPLLLLQASVGC